MLFLRPFKLRLAPDNTGKYFLLSDRGARCLAGIHGWKIGTATMILRRASFRWHHRLGAVGADCLTMERTVWPTGFAAHARRNVRDGREATRTTSHHAHYEI